MCKTLPFTLGPDTWNVCVEEPKKLQDMGLEELMQVEVQEKGSWWGYFLCALRGSSYTKGCEYNWFEDKCTCKGEFIPLIWRR